MPVKEGGMERELPRNEIIGECSRLKLSTHLGQLRGRIIGDVRVWFRINRLCGHQVLVAAVVIIIIDTVGAIAGAAIHRQQVGSGVRRGSRRTGAEPFEKWRRKGMNKVDALADAAFVLFQPTALL